MLDTGKIFGRGEQVHIVTPDYLQLPKLDLALADGVVIESGHFVNAAGEKATIGATKSWVGLVTEGSHYGDPKNRQKPHNGVEAYFGIMGIDMKKAMTTNGGTPFAIGDALSVIDGKVVHSDNDHVAVFTVTKVEADYIRFVTL